MEQRGEYTIAAGREEVWQALNDPEVLGQCIAGCQEVSKIDEQHFDVKVKAKIGPVSAMFQAALELCELNPPESYVLQGGVKGGAAGFAKGKAQVSLREAGDNTVLNYTVTANVGGKLAQVGSRLVDGAARKMADDFFAAFSQHLTPTAEGKGEDKAEDEIDAPATSASTESEASEANEKSAESALQGRGYKGAGYKGAGQWKIWLLAFIVLALSLLLTN